MIHFTYAIGFRASDTLKTFSLRTLNSGMWWFQEDVISWDTSKPFGAYRLISVDKAKNEFDTTHWPTNSSCPFVGTTLGFVLFEPWCDDDMEHYFLEEILWLGLGFVVKIDTNAIHDLVQKKEKTLFDITNRHGFGEGGEYLTQDPDYFQYIRNCIAEMLMPLDLEPQSFHAGDYQHILDGFANEKPEDWQSFYKHQHKIKKAIWIAEALPENFGNLNHKDI